MLGLTDADKQVYVSNFSDRRLIFRCGSVFCESAVNARISPPLHESEPAHFLILRQHQAKHSHGLTPSSITHSPQINTDFIPTCGFQCEPKSFFSIREICAQMHSSHIQYSRGLCAVAQQIIVAKQSR